jgi:O-methyltransferase
MLIPYKIRYFFRCLANTEDRNAAIAFLFNDKLTIGFTERLRFLVRIYRISLNTTVAHTEAEILAVATAVLSSPPDVPGCVVEAGCYKGGSTAKFSLVAKLAGRKLYAFDSFEGLPENDEQHGKTLDGQVTGFQKGRYLGTLDEVKSNISKWGDIHSTEFMKGWFDNTMPGFEERIVAGYLDVDLVSSTKTCLKYLFPLVQPGGALFSQDGHLPLIIDCLKDKRTWESDVGCPPPAMHGLGHKKLVRIDKAR